MPALDTASWVRRLLALAVDWFACMLVVVVLLGPGGWSESRWSGFDTMGVFVFESTLLTVLAGGSFGQLATRLRVVGVDGQRLTIPIVLVRQILICLVIPPLVFRPDGRGLHDLAARSATVTLQTALGRAASQSGHGPSS